MDAASSYLDYEICLSRRSDLIPAVLDRVLQAQLPGCADGGFRVTAHDVTNAEVVTLRFLIEEVGAVPQRNRLIVGGERLLDELFAASPWQRAPLVMEATAKRAVRPEIHVKCRPTNEETWYAGSHVHNHVQATLSRLTTDCVRTLRVRPHEMKNVLPVCAHRCCLRRGFEGWPSWAFSSTTDNDTRRKLVQSALALCEHGELALASEALNADERGALQQLERYLDDAAEVAGETNAVAALRFLLAQMGFSDMEADYTIVLGLAGQPGVLDAKEAA